MTNLENLSFYLSAKSPCIWIHTYEEARVIEHLKEIAFDEIENNAVYKIKLWSITEGLVSVPLTNYDTVSPSNVKLKNGDLLFDYIKSEIDKSAPPTLWILRDANKLFTQYPFIYRHIRDMKEYNRMQNYHPLIIISTEKNIPKELEKLCVYIEYDTLTDNELYEIVENMGMQIADKEQIQMIAPDEIMTIAKSLRGLTFIEVTNILKRSYVSEKVLSVNYIMAEKIKFIQKTEILDYKVPTASFDLIGGNEKFKQWVYTLRNVLHEDAASFGCEPPKGFLSLGVPGACKSYSAEALANLLHIPFLRFNISKIMSKLVGESEKNIEEALRLVKSCAPCVFLLDEVEKVLGAASNGGSNKTDGGTTSRVMSSILQFLQENNNGIITIMTSNDVSQLPPELTRSGRLDAIWYFGLPSDAEREQIFRIHLDRTQKPYNEESVQEIVALTKDFTGAEIENIVKKAVWHAFGRYQIDDINCITLEDLKAAKEEVVPIIDSYKEKINFLEHWSKGRALFASEIEKPKLSKEDYKKKYKNLLDA